jgi:predicted RNA-binding Zn-ribbon protein involved in translation (DUF1610 family)
MTGNGMIAPAYSDYAIREIINKLAEYEDIGTVEEFKALKEKSESKEARYNNEDGWETYICPSCGKAVGEHQKHCWNCGQAFYCR